MTKFTETILQIRDNNICTGCGTCAGVCSPEAIKMHIAGGLYVPEINEEKCVNCGLCVKSCPGYSVNFKDLNMRIFKRQPSDKALGHYLGCYIGHSNDFEIRYNSASGGIASQLLISALEKGIITGAVAVKMKSINPLETEAFIARTRKQVLDASKSKYCPVTLSEALRQILREDGKFAVVGLPCHIHGIRKAEQVCKPLKDRIVLHVGLMCSHAVSYIGTEFLLEKLGVNKKQVDSLSYRGNGWPGGLSVKMKNGSNANIPLLGSWHSYWAIFSSFFFTPIRCLMCPDEAAELADISLGDAWLPELRNDRVGKSVIVTRTKIAEDVLSYMSSTKAIAVMSVDSVKVKQTQGLNLKFKKDFFGARLATLRLFGTQTPKFDIQIDRTPSPIDFLRAFYPYLSIQLSSSKHVKSLLTYVPFPLFRLYFGVFKILALL
ncbi:Coenzyme F420 hydrogenase/dehydrogenase, beta subunit C-terminal domain [Candidatus Bathyarchaeota archaeon]|nr:Coenzyme F420 hydrogenase/dehydrogenase, beta subunit C-terminal domain [Candidatus Bathyarchaeota archaeon]